MNIFPPAALGVLVTIGAVNAQFHLDDDPRHRPHGVAEEAHRHAHPGVDLTHPIVTESPLPETHLRLDYTFADGEDGREHGFSLSGEYAFTPEFSVEAVLPYTLLDPAGDATVGGIGDAVVAMKLATYRFTDNRLLPAIGLEVVLPTGNEERGIGSDHVVELEPFLRVGYWAGRFEFIGSLALGIPLNQTAAEDQEEEVVLSYNLSTLYHVANDVQLLLELHGESIFGDADDTSFSISPGVTLQPFNDKSITIGLGATIPVTDDEPVDYALNAMMIVHF